MLTYLLEIAPDDNGTLLVTCPAFPEVTTYGEDKADARRHAIAAIEEAIAARISDGDALPPPAGEAALKRNKGLTVTLPLLTSLKAHLYTALRESGMTRAQLARHLGWHREQVDRLFRLDHASRLDQIEAAFKQLNQELDVRLRGRKIA
jgi:antitoxin HicB